ncbi:MAG TPA: glycosyltransferase family 1 protein [Acidimicrobiales bacterium]|jgi:glycosyltransferase involved in cell wall biosynthesis|nr:glycosyltransferase family 1 protein [Acidimicrobiales bacterium]
MSSDTGTPTPIRVSLDALPLLGHPTGVGAFCLGALRALHERPELSVSAYAVTWRRNDELRRLVPAGVPLARRPMPARPLQAIWGRYDTPPLEWFIGQVDIVHGTNSESHPTAKAAEVVTVHDLTPLRFPKLRNPAAADYADLIARALRRGAWIHTDSEFVASEVIESFGVDPGRVRTVAPGVPSLPVVSGDAAREIVGKLLEPEPERFILSIGTSEPRKDLPSLVRAFDAVASKDPGIALVLAGQRGWGEADLSAAISAARARERIFRTGWIDEVTLTALLHRASLLAYPSIYEGFGFPPLQAMAVGVPVVATSAGSLPEVLGEAAWLVEPDDEQGLIEGIAHVLDDESVTARLKAAGFERVSKFSWSLFAVELSRFYRDLLVPAAN